MAESNVDDVRARFGATAELVAEHAASQIESVREQLRQVRRSCAGTSVRSTAARARERSRSRWRHSSARSSASTSSPSCWSAPAATHRRTSRSSRATRPTLPFETGSFDLACSRRTLHHIAHPEPAIAELVRVTAPGGRVFVDDQIAPIDPLAAFELDRFERARDPSHTRTLPDVDFRHLFEANGLVLVRAAVPDAHAQARLLPRSRRLRGRCSTTGSAAVARRAARTTSPRAPGISCAKPA